MTRWTALFILTAINLLNYIDRYIFSALAPAMQRDLGFSDTELGLLGSAFILAYIVLAPVCGWWGDRGSRSKLMAAGVAVWSLSTALSGMARTFTGQLFSRVAVGVGESAYSVIAPSSIADFFPKSARGRVFAIYSGAIPVGSALGYILGEQLEKAFGWQKAFFFVGVPGLLCAAALFFLRDPKRGAEDVAHETGPDSITDHESKNPWAAFFKTCGVLFQNGGFNAVVLGYAAYTFVVGGLAFWMPAYIDRYFHVSNGITIFGAVTVVGGFIGTMLGGWWADHIEKKSGNGFLKVSVWSMVFAVPLFAVMLAMEDFKAFMVALFFMEIALFLCISPLDAAVITYVKPAMRATAMALNVFLIHALGDGISRALIGSISDHSGLKTALAFCPWILALAGVIWFVGLILFWHPLKWPENGVQPTRLIAHRGLWKPTRLQENTLAAFRAARDQGVGMIELDVMLSGDGRAVVFHDWDLKRLGGRDTGVDQTSAEQMKAWANAPLLEEVLRDPGVPDAVNVELKSNEWRDGRLEQEVARVVRACGAETRVEFSSFNPFSLRRIARLLPEAPRALLVTEEDDPRNKIYLRKMWLGFYCRPHLLHLDEAMLSRARLSGWRDRGIAVIAWTVNDFVRARELLSWNVRGIISDEALDLPEAPSKSEACKPS
ncbi:MAG: MFS transporter [Bdellovibrionaceae bacterium]|nr:MFS transporter [Pseudobdellovibrionaceae bacterium]